MPKCIYRKKQYFENLFDNVSNDIDKIFQSYRTLNDIYKTSLDNLKQTLELTQYQREKFENNLKMFENISIKVDLKQKEISSQLYEQGLVLLAGSSESILKQAFNNLVLFNLEKVNNPMKKRINFCFDDLKMLSEETKTIESIFLSKLHDDKDPTEKLNFQNVNQIKQIFKSYFELNFIDDEISVELHKYWQIRHIIIHNEGNVDENFINNLKKANIDVSDYKLERQIHISENEYNACKKVCEKLFKCLDEDIYNKDLRSIIF